MTAEKDRLLRSGDGSEVLAPEDLTPATAADREWFDAHRYPGRPRRSDPTPTNNGGTP